MTDSVARVLVDVTLNREFDYWIPEALRTQVAIGSAVRISFGKRETTGFVVGFAASSERVSLKPILGVLHDRPLLSPALIALARWISDYYCAPIEGVIRSMLPAAVRRTGSAFRSRRVAFATRRELSAAEWAALRKRSPHQAQALEVIAAGGGVEVTFLTRGYGIPSRAIVALEKAGLITLKTEPVARRPLKNRTFIPTAPAALMPQQAEALALIRKAMTDLDPPVVLLHGVTGSGKTEVYLQAIAHALSEGKGAIVLVPEISLTPQTVERFVGRFGETVAVLHSGLSDGERHDEWHRIRDGQARIVVGARSAVFAPVHPLGLIVVDEEHEPTYKQEESPRYHARDVAVMRGRLERCAVVLGTATPSFESFRNALQGKYARVWMPARVDHRRMPLMRVVDMAHERTPDGKPAILSRELLDLMGGRLARGEQTILFLNRRGYAASLVCLACGHVESCPDCSVAFTYHRVGTRLRCHICGSNRPVPPACPSCGDPAFHYAGLGTQRLERLVAHHFPDARIRRMDADTTSGWEAHWEILSAFKTGKTDILIGTQMIAKGLDFPNVTLIGIIFADQGLHAPDFRAGERTFQLLTQVAGRAGRGELPGDVVVQTFKPFHPVIQSALRLDYEAFYRGEEESRRELRYPPFGRMVCVTFRGPSEERTREAAERVARRWRERSPAGAIATGPMPAALARAKGLFRFQLLLRGPTSKGLTGPLRAVLAEERIPAHVSVVVDVDPVSLL